MPKAETYCLVPLVRVLVLVVKLLQYELVDGVHGAGDRCGCDNLNHFVVVAVEADLR